MFHCIYFILHNVCSLIGGQFWTNFENHFISISLCGMVFRRQAALQKEERVDSNADELTLSSSVPLSV